MTSGRSHRGPGELTSDDTITLARTAAEAIRGLNQAHPNCDAGLGHSSGRLRRLGALSMAASRLGQAPHPDHPLP